MIFNQTMWMVAPHWQFVFHRFIISRHIHSFEVHVGWNVLNYHVGTSDPWCDIHEYCLLSNKHLYAFSLIYWVSEWVCMLQFGCDCSDIIDKSHATPCFHFYRFEIVCLNWKKSQFGPRIYECTQQFWNNYTLLTYLCHVIE